MKNYIQNLISIAKININNDWITYSFKNEIR